MYFTSVIFYCIFHILSILSINRIYIFELTIYSLSILGVTTRFLYIEWRHRVVSRAFFFSLWTSLINFKTIWKAENHCQQTVARCVTILGRRHSDKLCAKSWLNIGRTTFKSEGKILDFSDHFYFTFFSNIYTYVVEVDRFGKPLCDRWSQL